MSSIQERLQLKRVPLDTWNVREQLCLASAVVRSGDQNWMSVSRALKTIGETNRPSDWYSQKSCAAQYGVLLENVETPKRKKRNSEGGVETPQESILKMLTQQRILEIQNTLSDMNNQYEQLKNVETPKRKKRNSEGGVETPQESILKMLTQQRILEIQNTLSDMNNQYEQLKNEITEVRNTSTTDDRLQELWTNIETAKRARERENARRAAWLKEREERRARVERTWRPPTTPPSTPSPAPPSSPLLTSLLKSSPVVTTPQHIPHPATIVDAVSPSAGAPTLSLLLEQPSHARESKHAAIEHIKSQLVQIEHQLKASSSSSSPVATLSAAVPAVDIDDIEIKAEDVYAFRDIDIHLPPVTTMHKGARMPDKPVLKKEESAPAAPTMSDTMEEQVLAKEEPVQEEAVARDVTTDVETTEKPHFEEVQTQPEPERQNSFPEVKFPTPEIKVIQPEDEKIKEEIKVPESNEKVVEDVGQEEVAAPEPAAEEATEREEAPDEVVEAPPCDAAEAPAEAEVPPVALAVDPGDIPLPPDEPAPIDTDLENIPSPVGPPPSNHQQIDDSPSETIEMIQQEMDKEEYRLPVEEKKEEVLVEQKIIENIKKEDDAEDCLPLKEILDGSLIPPEEVKSERLEEDTHTETDDDTPMELSREEEKDGKKKRDYSRKKKSDSRTCSGSESAAEASAPESPSASDERQHRLWRKSVMLVYSRLCAHKYASLFLRPISDDEAPGYSIVVKRPMDLTTIRRNIDAGVIRSTAELQRDVLLMLSNALMYNSSSHSVHAMAKEMHEEAQNQLGMLLAAQAHAGLVAAPPRRKRRPAAHHTPPKRRHT